MKKLYLILLLCAALFLGGCVTDLPPDDGTPAPPPFSGTFVYFAEEKNSDHDTFTFNGDGRTIWLDLSEELAAKIGLPSGKQTGTYVFLFHNEEYRYDKAEYFRINVGEERYQFSVPVGQTDRDTVAFYTSEGECLVFEQVYDY